MEIKISNIVKSIDQEYVITKDEQDMLLSLILYTLHKQSKKCIYEKSTT